MTADVIPFPGRRAPPDTAQTEMSWTPPPGTVPDRDRELTDEQRATIKRVLADSSALLDRWRQEEYDARMTAAHGPNWCRVDES